MIRAYCFPSGHIGFGRSLPAGTTIIARGPDEALRAFIGGNAHRAGHARTAGLLVPGMGGADNAIARQEALRRWSMWIATKAPKGVRVLSPLRGGSSADRAPDASHQEVASSNLAPRSTNHGSAR